MGFNSAFKGLIKAFVRTRYEMLSSAPRPQLHCFFNIILANPNSRAPRRGSATVRLLGLLVRIPPGSWMSVSPECCVFSSRGLCVGLRSPTEYGVSGCDREASIKRRPWPTSGCCTMEEKIFLNINSFFRKMKFPTNNHEVN